MILELRNYTNEKGMLLVERVLTNPTGQIPFDRFTGTCVIGIQGPEGVQAQQIDFPIPAHHQQEAFDLFEQSAKAFVEKMKQEASRRIMHASSMPDIPPPNNNKRKLIL
jgi:hypothetical protein